MAGAGRTNSLVRGTTVPVSTMADARGQVERCASNHALTLSVRKKLALVSLAWEGGSALGPRLALPWKKGEGRRWPTRESWHDSPVVRGGWPG
ncbi:hypothetical protein CRG98_020863 [Punica granatum]|uniref:Uncharacterized protein n=1 Tax=Punica granatum TaxID=22663 RepID=A0A2I0JSA6_PUNGR|nr:hypothetical protein CRG98_020863 [Punica granatum]